MTYGFWRTEKLWPQSFEPQYLPLEMLLMILGGCISFHRAPDGEDTLYANRFSWDTHAVTNRHLKITYEVISTVCWRWTVCYNQLFYIKQTQRHLDMIYRICKRLRWRILIWNVQVWHDTQGNVLDTCERLGNLDTCIIPDMESVFNIPRNTVVKRFFPSIISLTKK